MATCHGDVAWEVARPQAGARGPKRAPYLLRSATAERRPPPVLSDCGKYRLAPALRDRGKWPVPPPPVPVTSLLCSVALPCASLASRAPRPHDEAGVTVAFFRGKDGARFKNTVRWGLYLLLR